MQNNWQKLVLLIVITAATCGLIFYLLPLVFPTTSILTKDLPYILPSIVILSSLLISNIDRHNVWSVIQNIIIWLAILLLFIIFYVFRHDLKDNANRVLASIFPSYSFSNYNEELIIGSNNDGHFYIDAKVNSIPIKFMFDTGASSISLSKQDAIKLNINLDDLKFTKKVSTANGTSMAAPIMLKELKIGKFTFYNINAYVMEGENDISLLGMSLISKFKKFKLEKDMLKLSY